MREIELDNCLGYILNVSTSSLWGLRKSRHWYAIRKVDSSDNNSQQKVKRRWLVLDSYSSRPEILTSEEELFQHLNIAITEKQAQVLVVIP